MEAIAVLASLWVLAIICGWQLRSVIETIRKRRMAEKRTIMQEPQTYQNGFIAGLNLGMQKFGQHLRVNHDPSIQGFAIRCRNCHHCIAAFSHVKQEYIKCPLCKFRNATPIPEEDFIQG